MSSNNQTRRPIDLTPSQTQGRKTKKTKSNPLTTNEEIPSGTTDKEAETTTTDNTKTIYNKEKSDNEESDIEDEEEILLKEYNLLQQDPSYQDNTALSGQFMMIMELDNSTEQAVFLKNQSMS